jgi:hypothetical protein
MMSKGSVLVLMAGILLPAPLSSAQAEGKGKAEVVSLSVSKSSAKDDKDLVPNYGLPVRIGILATLPESGIVRLEEKKSKVTKFSDDKGTDLLQKKAKSKDDFFGDPGPIGAFPKVGKDLKTCYLEIQSQTVPASGAKSLTLEGTLLFMTGKGQDVDKQEIKEPKRGATFKIGTASFRIDDVGKPKFGDAPFQVILSSKEGARVVKVRFLDADGKEIESSSPGSGTSSFGDSEPTYSWTYDLKREVKSFTVEATLWKQVATVEVPLKLTVTLGL